MADPTPLPVSSLNNPTYHSRIFALVDSNINSITNCKQATAPNFAAYPVEIYIGQANKQDTVRRVQHHHSAAAYRAPCRFEFEAIARHWERQ